MAECANGKETSAEEALVASPGFCEEKAAVEFSHAAFVQTC